MKLLFIIDPLDHLVVYKDTSIAMMREAQARGHEVWFCEDRAIWWQENMGQCLAQPLTLLSEAPWFSPGAPMTRPLNDFSALLLRKDPPFNQDYVALTWLLENIARQGVPVFNNPRAVRDTSEKLSILEFPELIPPSLVTSDKGQLLAFLGQHHECVVKPLDSMGGSGVFRITEDDPNRKVILETLTSQGRRLVMAQQYIPAIRDGDKRVILIDGQPFPAMLARVPAADDFRGNLAAGAQGQVRPLGEMEAAIAHKLGPILASRGLLLVGLDIIGNRLTEINVTSPTGFVELGKCGWPAAAYFMDALEKHARR